MPRDSVLLERETAGLRVRLSWLEATDEVALTVDYDGQQATNTVPGDRALDAFDHPVLYLTEPQVLGLGVK